MWCFLSVSMCWFNLLWWIYVTAPGLQQPREHYVISSPPPLWEIDRNISWFSSNTADGKQLRQQSGARGWDEFKYLMMKGRQPASIPSVEPPRSTRTEARPSWCSPSRSSPTVLQTNVTLRWERLLWFMTSRQPSSITVSMISVFPSPVLGWYSQAGTLVAILFRVSDGSGTEMWIGSETWIALPSLSKSWMLTTARAVRSVHPVSAPAEGRITDVSFDRNFTDLSICWNNRTDDGCFIWGWLIESLVSSFTLSILPHGEQ